MDCSSTPVVLEGIDVTTVKFAVSGYDVCFVFPSVVSVETGIWGNSDVI